MKGDTKYEDNLYEHRAQLNTRGITCIEEPFAQTVNECFDILIPWFEKVAKSEAKIAASKGNVAEGGKSKGSDKDTSKSKSSIGASLDNVLANTHADMEYGSGV